MTHFENTKSKLSNPVTAAQNRWYDHDPLLVELFEMLRAYPDALSGQATVFLDKIRLEVGEDHLNQLFEGQAPLSHSTTDTGGKRWYDGNKDLSQAIALLKLLPPEAQNRLAEQFILAMQRQGLTQKVLNT
ncbi:MAG: hypothetical protein AAGI66_07215 [Cyanobacteria bacterium P01_H01_bin.74]